MGREEKRGAHGISCGKVTASIQGEGLPPASPRIASRTCPRFRIRALAESTTEMCDCPGRPLQLWRQRSADVDWHDAHAGTLIVPAAILTSPTLARTHESMHARSTHKQRAGSDALICCRCNALQGEMVNQGDGKLVRSRLKALEVCACVCVSFLCFCRSLCRHTCLLMYEYITP